jgi:protein-tyrosine phosphatase
MRSFRTKTNAGVSDAPPASGAENRVRVVFVCWGNICRSPIAERVAERAAASAELDNVEFSSAAAENPNHGEPMDRRATAALKARGYRYNRHGAHQITASEIADADLVIAMEDIHIEMMRTIAPDATNLSLLTDYDPDAEPASGVPDPWFGSAAGFFLTVDAIEAAMPGVLQRVREIQAKR